MNYVCSHQVPESADDELDSEDDPRPLVVVTIGGGDGGADSVVVPFLEMMRRYADRIDFRAEVVLGPLIDADMRARCTALAEGLPVRLREFVPAMEGLVRRAEVAISTAGYNTVTDMLSFARRWVLVPRVLYREEQRIRARILSERGLCTYLDPDEATADRMWDAIEQARQGESLERAREQGLPLDGVSQFVSLCSKLTVQVPATLRDGLNVI